MNIGKEFEKYAIKHRGIGSNSLHQYQNSVTNLTPYIIEERPMNVASMDVFSRLMMDRIIFLGEGINDYVANIVTAQLLKRSPQNGAVRTAGNAPPATAPCHKSRQSRRAAARRD